MVHLFRVEVWNLVTSIYYFHPHGINQRIVCLGINNNAIATNPTAKDYLLLTIKFYHHTPKLDINFHTFSWYPSRQCGRTPPSSLASPYSSGMQWRPKLEN